MSDISTTSWSEVDASNNQTAPEGWPAGMFPNAVEPSARMNMAAVKRFWNHINPTYAATLSTTDTFTVTETQTRAGYGLNERFATRFPSANLTTSPTVNHSSLGAQLIQKWNAAGALVNVAVGDIQAQMHEYYWNAAQMVLLNPTSAQLSATNKATPTSSDSILITDAAAAGVQKAALLSALSTLPGTYPTKATPTSSDSVVITDAAASNAGKTAVVGALVSAVSPFSRSYTSAQQTITAAGALTLAHGFGVQPSLVQCKLHCTTGQFNYAIGDEVVIDNSTNDVGSAASRGVSIVPDATNLNIRFGSDANTFAILDKTTGAGSQITNGNWTIIFKAWA
jgi:hypothetical protein